MGEDNDTAAAPRTGGEVAAKDAGGSSRSSSPQSKAQPAAKEAPPDNPFDQYYAQLTHQQNMLQDSVRVSAYQRAIMDNAADIKVWGKEDQIVAGGRPAGSSLLSQPPLCAEPFGRLFFVYRKVCGV